MPHPELSASPGNGLAQPATFAALQGVALTDFQGSSSEVELQRAQGTISTQGHLYKPLGGAVGLCGIPIFSSTIVLNS